MQLAFRNCSRVSFPSQERPRLLSKNRPTARRWMERTEVENFLGDDDLTWRKMWSRWSTAREKIFESFLVLSLFLFLSRVIKYSEQSNSREKGRDRASGTVPCTCENSCESWHIARRGSCFRETTLDESDGDGGGGDVPRYPYAICMEENMRTPVYNLAVADVGLCEVRACASWRRWRAHRQKPAARWVCYACPSLG